MNIRVEKLLLVLFWEANSFKHERHCACLASYPGYIIKGGILFCDDNLNGLILGSKHQWLEFIGISIVYIVIICGTVSHIPLFCLPKFAISSSAPLSSWERSLLIHGVILRGLVSQFVIPADNECSGPFFQRIYEFIIEVLYKLYFVVNEL